MHTHIPIYKCHLNTTLLYVCLCIHFINTIATRIQSNKPINDALTELPLLPALSRFGPLHLSVEQQAIYKKREQCTP